MCLRDLLPSKPQPIVFRNHPVSGFHRKPLLRSHLRNQAKSTSFPTIFSPPHSPPSPPHPPPFILFQIITCRNLKQRGSCHLPIHDGYAYIRSRYFQPWVFSLRGLRESDRNCPDVNSSRVCINRIRRIEKENWGVSNQWTIKLSVISYE